MHMWSPMWPFHQVHHSDDFVDATTTYRTHPVETVWRFTFAIMPIWLLGLRAQAVAHPKTAPGHLRISNLLETKFDRSSATDGRPARAVESCQSS